MNKVVIAVFTFLISSVGFCFDDTEYNQLLDRHAKAGHLTESQAESEKFKYANNKRWQGNLTKQVRGVASSFKENSDIINFKNPTIEISSK